MPVQLLNLHSARLAENTVMCSQNANKEHAVSLSNIFCLSQWSTWHSLILNALLSQNPLSLYFGSQIYHSLSSSTPSPPTPTPEKEKAQQFFYTSLHFMKTPLGSNEDRQHVFEFLVCGIRWVVQLPLILVWLICGIAGFSWWQSEWSIKMTLFLS